jgi:hypothetical protein
VDPLPLSLADVYLLTAESNGQQAVGGLTLVIDHQGLAVLAPNGTVAADLAWSELSLLRTAGRTSGPGGENAVYLEASSGARTHTFVVPTGDADAFESTIAVVTGVPAPAPARRSRRQR